MKGTTNMKKYKKGLVLLLALVVLMPVIPVEAKVEETTEVELIDMGHGIWVPSSFDVVDENGNYVTLSKVDASYCEMQEIDEESYSIILDNGYRAEKEWAYVAGITDKAYARTTIYNENGDIVFTLGNDFMGQIVFAMQDEAGNYVKNTYSRNVVVDLENDEFESYYVTNEDDSTIRPLTRQTYNSEEQVQKIYKKWGNVMQLDSKYEYDTEGGGTCTVYGKTVNKYDKEDEYYENFSYKKDDLKEYTYNTVFHIYGQGRAAYGPCNKVAPTKITQRGQELYIYWLDNYFTDIEWSSADQDMEEILDGRPMQQNYYFTQEQIDILEKEGIKTVDELMKKYPEFSETFGAYVDTLDEDIGKEEPEEIKEAREKEESIISLEEQATPQPTETPTEAPTEAPAEEVPEEKLPVVIDDKWRISADGSRVCWQELTGDAVPINGMIPAHVMTQEMNTPYGIRCTAILYDENYNMIVHCMNFDLEHTNYEYAYITTMDFALGMAEIAGTDTPISGNLHYLGETTYETESDPVTGDVYGEYVTEPGADYYDPGLLE